MMKPRYFLSLFALLAACLLIPQAHAGYITWEQFEVNQKRLAENALGFGKVRKAGPAREGPLGLRRQVTTKGPSR